MALTNLSRLFAQLIDHLIQEVCHGNFRSTGPSVGRHLREVSLPIHHYTGTDLLHHSLNRVHLVLVPSRADDQGHSCPPVTPGAWVLDGVGRRLPLRFTTAFACANT